MNTVPLLWLEVASLDPELVPAKKTRAQDLAVVIVLLLRVPVWLLLVTPPGWSMLWALVERFMS